MLRLGYAPEKEFLFMINTIFKGKYRLIRSIVIGFVAGAILFGVFAPDAINADTKSFGSTVLVKNDHLTFCNMDKALYGVKKKVKMVLTAYSSTPDQTDDTPFITASGKTVIDGIVANNMLPFGTKIRIPELYGDKVFIVEDRMHKRKGKYQTDIWFSDYQEAKEFGAKLLDIEILES